MTTHRPVLSLPFISERIQKVVTRHVEEHLQNDDLHDSYQFVYQRENSTKTVLLKRHNDIAETLNEGFMLALILLDSPAAFDITDSVILLK